LAITASSVGAANAAISVLGGRLATTCYERVADGALNARALDVCNTALEEEPLTARDRAATLVNRGIIYLRRGYHDHAMADFDAAIRIRPALAEGYINRGAAFLQQENYRAAIDAFSEGINRTPEDPARAYYARAIAYEEVGDISAAYADYNRAAELSPDWSAPRSELTRFQVRRRN
jgi:tetratricopeptide (TPR) repeat protein